MKQCTKCHLLREISEFGKDKSKIDGLYSSCKNCVNSRNTKYRKLHRIQAKEYAKKYREINREILKKKSWITYYTNWEKRAEDGKKYYNERKQKIAEKRANKRREEEEREKNRLRQKKWRDENKSQIAKHVSGWKKRNPQKSAAHTLVLWAVRSGVLIKPERCSECQKKSKIEAHHNDYLKPLEVIWLCKICHSKKHRIYR